MATSWPNPMNTLLAQGRVSSIIHVNLIIQNVEESVEGEYTCKGSKLVVSLNWMKTRASIASMLGH